MIQSGATCPKATRPPGQINSSSTAAEWSVFLGGLLMDDSDSVLVEKAHAYGRRHGQIITDRLGFGMDGAVFSTNHLSAIKVHERQHAYRCERDVYLRLQKCGVEQVVGHFVPQLIDHEDELRVVEMSIVKRPYLLDFAKAQLDTSPDVTFSAEVMSERRQYWAELFGNRWGHVQAIMYELERRCGIYLLDPTPSNIAFTNDV